eukprot:gb/GEZN01009162.1/.p1 GENE.gb/GEZN01009162.1/~~gb/GEZN01009162.1/.p1  ORF type:complete len:297 (-),score=26.02 gb/GEZN01009162.1/:417-1307(-)
MAPPSYDALSLEEGSSDRSQRFKGEAGRCGLFRSMSLPIRALLLLALVVTCTGVGVWMFSMKGTSSVVGVETKQSNEHMQTAKGKESGKESKKSGKGSKKSGKGSNISGKQNSASASASTSPTSSSSASKSPSDSPSASECCACLASDSSSPSGSITSSSSASVSPTSTSSPTVSATPSGSESASDSVSASPSSQCASNYQMATATKMATLTPGTGVMYRYTQCQCPDCEPYYEGPCTTQLWNWTGISTQVALGNYTYSDHGIKNSFSCDTGGETIASGGVGCSNGGGGQKKSPAR